MERRAEARWRGNLKDGRGTLRTSSGELADAPYSFATRFEESKRGTKPEELVAAAHAGGFAMALAAKLAERRLTAESIDASATVTIERAEACFTVTRSPLDVRARV